MTNKKVMYMGPTLRGVARSGSVFENGLPANLSKLAEKKPIIKNLIVPLAETTFGNISREYFDFITQTGQITYRGSMQVLNTATQTNDFESIVVTTKGKVKAFDLGSLKKGGKGEPKVTREVTYCKITIAGSTVLELDKYNMIWKLNGVDRLQKVRSQI